uniref:Uncharacterized protein n=1 Tax=Chrysotila carterae TaxID=13221 RepID=A0A7S4AYH8_CHRCT
MGALVARHTGAPSAARFSRAQLQPAARSGISASTSCGRRCAVASGCLARVAMMAGPIESYEQLLLTSPLLTKAVTNAALFAVGDLLAQRVESPDAEVDLQRLSKFVLTGLGSGVLWATYYDFADELMSPIDDMTSRLVSSILVEQFLWCPLVYSAYLIPCKVLLDGGTPADVVSQVREKLGSLLLANAKVWTPANIIIYSTPLEWRLLCSNCVDLIWSAVCSNLVSTDAAATSGGQVASADKRLLLAEQQQQANFLAKLRPVQLRLRSVYRLARSQLARSAQ